MREFAEFERPSVPLSFAFETRAALAAGSNRFAFELWRQVRREGKNAVLSPASVTLVMTMLWAGARGETALEIASPLRLQEMDDVHAVTAEILRKWSNPDRDSFVLRVVNRLFGDLGYTFNESYLDLVRQRYGAPLEPVDFRHAPEEVRGRINAWVEGQTSGRIRDLLVRESVNKNTSMVAVNAVYLRAQWVSSFADDETTPEPFYPETGGSTQVPTMHQTTDLGYAEDDDVQVLAMSYRNSSFSMTIVLPRRRDGLRDLESRISVETLDTWSRRLERRRVAVSLPRFRIAPPTVDLKPILQSMGIRTAFDARAADFTAIADPTDPATRLFLAGLVQKAFIDVNESGTEAAAATAALMDLSAPTRPPKPPPAVPFIADHPFLFVIRDGSNRMILFVGRVANPAESV